MYIGHFLVAATVLVGTPLAANAQAVSGLYIGAGAGANFLQNETAKSSVFSQVRSTPLSAARGIGIGSNAVRFDTGFTTLASVGYGLGNGLRLEVEASFRQNGLKGALGRGAGGDQQKFGGMVNALYDIDPAVLGLESFSVVPYVGVGVGYQWAQLRNGHAFGPLSASAPVAPRGSYLLRTNDADGAFAYQAIVGASYSVASVPGLSLTAEYRFMGMTGDRSYNFEYISNRPAPGVSTLLTSKFDENFNHSVMLGVRYAFNSVPSPVPAQQLFGPSPIREPGANTYLIFFDWNKADLTERARHVVSDAAQRTTRNQVTKIQVNGFTDTSGTAKYNQGLSLRRGQSVVNELVKNGIPRAAILIQGFGGTRLLVPTVNGVREAQNRRVEIILQ